MIDREPTWPATHPEGTTAQELAGISDAEMQKRLLDAGPAWMRESVQDPDAPGCIVNYQARWTNRCVQWVNGWTCMAYRRHGRCPCEEYEALGFVSHDAAPSSHPAALADARAYQSRREHDEELRALREEIARGGES